MDRPPVSDSEQLLARSRAGDADAFCELLEVEQGRLLRQALGMAGDQQAAEDLVCETMAEAWRSIGRYNGSCRLSTWLFAILLHRFQKHLRSTRFRPVPASSLPHFTETPDRDVLATDSTPANELMLKERAEVVRLALARMEQKHREVLLMRFFQGASLEEIAAALDCPVGTVKSRLHYALEELRGMRAALNPE